MAQVVDTIAEVETKTLPTGTVIYVLKTAGGVEVTTRDKDIAKEAYALIPTAGIAQIDYTEKQGGQFNQFTNRYLNKLTVLPDNSAGPPAQTFQPDGSSDPFADSEPGPDLPVGRDRDAEKELSINKAVALKAAVDLMQHFPEEERTVTNVTGAAEYLLHWLQEYRP